MDFWAEGVVEGWFGSGDFGMMGKTGKRWMEGVGRRV